MKPYQIYITLMIIIPLFIAVCYHIHKFFIRPIYKSYEYKYKEKINKWVKKYKTKIKNISLLSILCCCITTLISTFKEIIPFDIIIICFVSFIIFFKVSSIKS